MSNSNAPINDFEIVESIRFFASLVATEGITETIKDKANIYLEKLVDLMEESVQKTCAERSGIHLLKG